MTGDWKKNCAMRSVVIFLFFCYYNDDQIKEDGMGGACRIHARNEKYVQYCGRKSEVKTLLGGLRRRWEDNIKIDRNRIEWQGVDWIHVAWDSDQWAVLVNTNEILDTIKGEEFRG
jgi:hypothetical protein